MSDRRQVVVGAPAGHDDDLALSRPPGVLRRFWARHPRLADVLVAALAALLSTPWIVFRGDAPEPAAATAEWIGAALLLGGCAALVARRRVPLLVFAAVTVPGIVASPDLAVSGSILPAFGVYAVAVYRSSRACWTVFGLASAALVVAALIWSPTRPEPASFVVTTIVSGVVTLLIGALIGVNVGGRRRYLLALIDRSRQLAVERDQQAALAAAAERTRIAREMHDIVSHSLTVIVALSEGAAAATSPEQARRASRATADTARGALAEMREMLGVLREGADDDSPLEPLEPVDPAEVVGAARGAGFRVVLHRSGELLAAPRAVRFALGRVVQEGLTNAMRHGPSSSEIRVSVDAGPERIVVRVENDRLPAGRASTDRTGFGLRGLGERVSLVGGTLQAGPADPHAWLLVAVFPLPVPAPEDDS